MRERKGGWMWEGWKVGDARFYDVSLLVIEGRRDGFIWLWARLISMVGTVRPFEAFGLIQIGFL